MRTYITVTGIVFALVFVAHIARVALEGLHTLREPIFDISSLIAAGLAWWSFKLLRKK